MGMHQNEKLVKYDEERKKKNGMKLYICMKKKTLLATTRDTALPIFFFSYLTPSTVDPLGIA